MPIDEQTAHDALWAIPDRCRGPGGAVVIVSEGRVVGQRLWGYADLELNIPMTSKTIFPICSITKQMLCGTLVDLETNHDAGLREKMWAKAKELLPKEQLSGLTLDHLCDNHSGIRDYWALTTLWGARLDGPFSLASDAEPMRKRLGGFHFTPGTEYSYSNGNFHIVARLLEMVTGESLEVLLTRHIFTPAGMATANLCPDNAVLPPPCIGYEGSENTGYVPATNLMQWSGDAGVVASLDDMAAYESYLDRSLSDPKSWYYRAALEPAYYDDEAATPTSYRRGLRLASTDGIATAGHGGALRGFRLHRLQAPKKRLSVVVMLNHEADAAEIAELVLRHALHLKQETPKSKLQTAPSAAWDGVFLDEGTQLAITVSTDAAKGEIVVSYAGGPERIKLVDPNRAESRNAIVKVDGDRLTMQRHRDNRLYDARRLHPADLVEPWAPSTVFCGTYRCAAVDSVFHCRAEGTGSGAGWLYGSFEGFLGSGPARPMRRLGKNVWAITCPRGLDAPAPGDWTAVFLLDANGLVTEVTIGCWLARKLQFVKTS